MPTPTKPLTVEEIIEGMKKENECTGIFCEHDLSEIHYVIDENCLNIITEAHQRELEEVVKVERERINQYFAAKADYDTDNDCVIITDKIYHRAFFPDGCGSDGQEGRNHCKDCYKYRTPFGQKVLSKLEPKRD